MEFTLFQELLAMPAFSWVALGVAVVMVGLLISLVLRNYRKREEVAALSSSAERTRALVYGALCVALSFILGCLKLFTMPQGGSLTPASALPLAAYAWCFGTKRGLLAGSALGILQLLQGAYVIHPVQFLLDYVLAYACIGVAGSFKGLIAGIIVGGIGRILCSVFSGVFFFASFAPPQMNVWAYSVGYNFLAMGPDVILCVVVALLPPVKKVIGRMRPAA